MEIFECCGSYFSMMHLKGAFAAYHSSDVKSSVLESGNHKSPFDTRSSIPRVPAGKVLANSLLLQQLALLEKIESETRSVANEET